MFPVFGLTLRSALGCGCGGTLCRPVNVTARYRERGGWQAVLRRGFLGLIVLGCGALGCDAALPDPESPGARLYAQRCSGCHRLYAPGVLTAKMWDVMVSRMDVEFRRWGVSPLAARDRQRLLEYLHQHSQDGAGTPREQG